MRPQHRNVANWAGSAAWTRLGTAVPSREVEHACSCRAGLLSMHGPCASLIVDPGRQPGAQAEPPTRQTSCCVVPNPPAGSQAAMLQAFNAKLAELTAQLDSAKAAHRRLDDDMGRVVDSVRCCRARAEGGCCPRAAQPRGRHGVPGWHAEKELPWAGHRAQRVVQWAWQQCMVSAFQCARTSLKCCSGQLLASAPDRTCARPAPAHLFKLSPCCLAQVNAQLSGTAEAQRMKRDEQSRNQLKLQDLHMQVGVGLPFAVRISCAASHLQRSKAARVATAGLSASC